MYDTCNGQMSLPSLAKFLVKNAFIAEWHVVSLLCYMSLPTVTPIYVLVGRSPRIVSSCLLAGMNPFVRQLQVLLSVLGVLSLCGFKRHLLWLSIMYMYVLHVVHASIADLNEVPITINTYLTCSLWSLGKRFSTNDKNLCPMLLVLTFSLNRGSMHYWMSTSFLVIKQNMYTIVIERMHAH